MNAFMIKVLLLLTLVIKMFVAEMRAAEAITNRPIDMVSREAQFKRKAAFIRLYDLNDDGKLDDAEKQVLRLSLTPSRPVFTKVSGNLAKPLRPPATNAPSLSK